MKTELIRAFLALDMPEQIKEGIFDLYQPFFRKDTPFLRWTKKENLHLTIKFLGDVTEQQITQISEIVRDLKPADEKYEFMVHNYGMFPPEMSPKVLWIGLKENDKLDRLVHEIEDRLSLLGFEKERRKFTPHITIGRLKIRNSFDLKLFEKIKTDLDKGFIRMTKESFFINSVTFYQSTLRSQGAVYTKMREF
ncbi:MAG: RNA 2',3'-cyclic phosphodiesterase [bacterium]|nr:RNA 2',3'-cyclic phosphodiesterase [bacterium]